MAIINRFGIKQPNGEYLYHEIGASADNVLINNKTLTQTLSELEDNVNLKYNAAGGVVTGEIIPAGGLSYCGKEGYITYPEGGKLRTFSELNGQLKIILPISWDNTLIKFKISIANYKENTSVDYVVSGFMNAATQKWEQCSAFALGRYYENLSNLTVRFGHNGSTCVVTIGELDTLWTFVSVAVSDINVSKTIGDDNFSTWAQNWNILIDGNSNISFSANIDKPHIIEEIKSAASQEVASALTEANAYTDQKIADLIDSAPETLDTLKELAIEIKDNETAIDTINQLITAKADKTALEGHTNNTVIHVSEAEKLIWNSKQDAIVFDGILSPDSTNPVQNATIYHALNTKVSKVDGKELSSNDFTNEYKQKLDNIEINANNYIHPESSVLPGAYRKVTVDKYGHVIEGSNSTLTVAEGGTGATSAEDALKNLGLIATAGELNKLNGVTISSIELNQLSSIKSNIQAQLDAKASLDIATQAKDGLLSSSDKTKLDNVADGANLYEHPKYSIAQKGLYNIIVDDLGHISHAEPVVKADIVNLGIPASDTTYQEASQYVSGLMSASDKAKLDTIDANSNKYELPTASNTTLGGVKTTSTVTSTNGYIATPIIKGVPYYKDTTYDLSSITGVLSLDKGGTGATTTEQALVNLGFTASAQELNYCKGVTANIQTQLNTLETLIGSGTDRITDDFINGLFNS